MKKSAFKPGQIVVACSLLHPVTRDEYIVAAATQDALIRVLLSIYPEFKIEKFAAVKLVPVRKKQEARK